MKLSETLYAKYIKDRSGYDILENESGFMIYKIIDKECFIVDVCVEKELRGLGKGLFLLNELKEIAKSKGCEFLSGTVHVSDPNAATILRAELRVGFKIVAADKGAIFIIKDIREG